MHPPKVSVILCTHNPRKEFLIRALDALRAQTLSAGLWELVVVDNHSQWPIREWIDLTWHPFSSVIQEDALGLTPARLRGIRETAGCLIVFVDDDNILAPDYLEQALEIAGNWPMLGVWGGSIRGEFEAEVPSWYLKHLNRLAVSEISTDSWTNERFRYSAIPCGAGMCIRRGVADEYATIVARSSLRRTLDRTGTSLSSCGDVDLAMCAIDLGMGVGRFHALRMTHIITGMRLSEEYLLRLVEADACSNVCLKYERGCLADQPRNALASVLRQFYLFCRLERLDYQIWRASLRGEARAKRLLHAYEAEGKSAKI